MPILWTQSVGLHISGLDLRVAVIRKSFKTQRLEKTEIIPDFLGLPEAERLNVFKAFVRKHRLPHSRVYLSLGREAGIVRQVEFPIQIAERVSSAAALQIETLSPWPIEDVYWSCSHELPPKGSKTFRATIVIAPRSAIDPWIEFFKKAGFPLSGASTSTPAIAHAAVGLWGAAKSIVLLGCEPQSLESVLVSTGQLSSVNAEVENFAVDAPAVLERLMSAGGLSSSEGVTVFAHGASVQELDVESVRLPLDGAVPESPHHFGAIATAFLGLGRSAFDSNLVPPLMRHRYSRLLMAPTIALVVLLAALGVVSVGRAPYQTLVYAGLLDSEISKVAPQVKDVSTQEAALDRANQRLVTLNSHVRNRDANLEALRELARVLPQEAWVSNYSSQDGAISISGLAASAAQVQKALEDSVVFKDAQLTATVVKDPSGKDRFSIRTSLEQPR